MERFDSSEAQVQRLHKFEESSWSLPPQHLQWDSPLLQQAIGNWSEGICFLLGVENQGKSSTLISRIVPLLKNNPDLCVLDISLDDSFEERCRRYLSVLSNTSTEKIGRPILCTEKELAKRKVAYDILETIFLGGQLEIKTEEENGVAHISNIIKEIEQFAINHPEKKLLVLLDSWHDVLLPESKSIDPEKEALIELKKVLKKYKSICLTTAHKRKSLSGAKTNNDDLKGSSYLKYAAKVMLTLNNDLKANRDEAILYYTDPKDTSEKLPIIELSVSKNKTSSYSDSIFFYFNPETGNTREVSEKDDRMYRTILMESRKKK